MCIGCTIHKPWALTFCRYFLFPLSILYFVLFNFPIKQFVIHCFVNVHLQYHPCIVLYIELFDIEVIQRETFGMNVFIQSFLTSTGSFPKMVTQVLF